MDGQWLGNLQRRVAQCGTHISPGVHTATLTVDDGDDTIEGPFQDSDEVEITVIADLEPPAMILRTHPLQLAPRNHKYETIRVTDFVIAVSDDCTALTPGDVVISGVTSSEPDDTGRGGDGRTSKDIVIASDRKSVDLRRERLGGSNGRIYTINVEAVDNAGNATAGSFQVQVPHN